MLKIWINDTPITWLVKCKREILYNMLAYLIPS